MALLVSLDHGRCNMVCGRIGRRDGARTQRFRAVGREVLSSVPDSRERKGQIAAAENPDER